MAAVAGASASSSAVKAVAAAIAPANNPSSHNKAGGSCVSFPGTCGGGHSLCHRSRSQSCSRWSFAVRAATTLTNNFKTLSHMGDRSLVKVKSAEEKSIGGILHPTSGQWKPTGGEVVAVADGRLPVVGDKKVGGSIDRGRNVVVAKYAGSQLGINGQDHVLVRKDEAAVGAMVSDDVNEMKPLGDRVLIRLAEAEEKTAGGVLLTESTKEKPSIGTVVAVGSGQIAEDGSRRPLDVAVGDNVMYSKYAGQEYKSADGTQYVVVRASDIMALMS
ncbi:hypothetical protein CBR_g23279 [Chara braunii]|uniref:20 kDa chaperonin, chloroplastic n=1 Tax=Chara braunii TaxID=69332 RepID=A0A388JVF5_CHABU|nr:hypothetical protein CBR_g23279 [Chara braunii]|eukprot:GBG61765.1 hypothetical protein CBR_g23279 [Chara braunii]